MFYKLIVSRFEGGKIKEVNISTMSEPLAVLRQLAACFRDCDKKNRKNEKIIKARMWEAFNANGLKCQKFSFELLYNESNHYLYEYEFNGCGLD